MTTVEQRVDRLEQVLEELLAGQKRLEKGQEQIKGKLSVVEGMVNFMAVKLLLDDDIQQMADMVRELEQGDGP